MKFTAKIFLSVILMLFSIVIPAMAMAPTLDLEKQIAYEQGHFGALYAQCGSSEDREVIGGTLTNWRMETFRGYNGSSDERTALEAAFDAAARGVVSDTRNCQDWIKKSATAWHNIIHLSQYGTPVASN